MLTAAVGTKRWADWEIKRGQSSAYMKPIWIFDTLLPDNMALDVGSRYVDFDRRLKSVRLGSRTQNSTAGGL